MRHEFINLQAGQNMMITLHVQRADDVLFRSPVLSSAKRFVTPLVEEFLIEEAEDLAASEEINLLVKVEESEPTREVEIVNAIHNHFACSSRNARNSVKKIVKLGWISLMVSFVFLMFMFLIAFSITTFLPENTIMITFRELFIILGWVALWRPADLLLYEWRSFKRQQKLLTRLAHCKVIFQ